MTPSQKVHARYERFASLFLRPLLAGGTMIVGRPVAPGMLEHFSLARPSDSGTEHDIYERLLTTANQFAPVKGLRWPDPGPTALAMAGHNLLAATDPMLGRWPGPKAKRKMLEWSGWLLDRASAPRTRGEALARHAILERLLLVRREDVVVRNWGFTHKYLGRPIPSGFLNKPRWVRENRDRRTLRDLISEQGDVDAGLVLQTLIRRSPMTELLRPDLYDTFRFGTASLAILSDDLLRNSVARDLAKEGFRAAESLGEALHVLYESNPPPRMLYYALALVYEMQVIAALDRQPPPPPLEVGESGMERGQQLFYAVLPAVLGAPDDLGALLDLDPDDLARLRVRAQHLDSVLSDSASQLAVAILDRAEPPHLIHERDSDPQLLEARP